MNIPVLFIRLSKKLAYAAQLLYATSTNLKVKDAFQQRLRLTLIVHAEDFQVLSTQLWNDETFPNYTYDKQVLQRYCALYQLTEILRPDVGAVIEYLEEFPETEEIREVLTKLLQVIDEVCASVNQYK